MELDIKINLDSLKDLENNPDFKVDAIKFQKMLREMKAGPETEIAPTTRPSSSRSGAATATRPTSNSSLIIAKPRRRTSSNSSSKRVREVIVLSVKRSSLPAEIATAE